MNRKLALLIGILAFFAVKTMAQDYKYGIYLGINGSNMSINSNLYYDDSEVFTKTIVDNTGDTTYQVRYLPIDDAKLDAMTPSFTIGGYYEMPLTKDLGVQFHLLYNKYGYTIKGKVDQPDITDEFSVEYDYTGEMKMTNLSAALLLKIALPAEGLSIQAGVTPSLCVRAQKNVERGPLHKTLNYKSSDEYKPLNICGTIGITYYYLDCIMFSLTANIGLTDVLRTKEPYLDDIHDRYGTVKYRYTDTKSSTNSVSLTAGYRF